ncbi:MAG: hypothetical protein ACM3JC_15180 [Rudaea sp.]
MRSSRLALALALVVAAAAAILAHAASAADGMRCRAGGQAAATNELRRAVERSPLYRVLAATSPVVGCEAEQADTRTILAYRFRDGASLRVERDAATESTRQEARVGSTFRARPVAVLKRAERAAFGAGGCGIDWRAPATQAPGEPPQARVTVYRGDVCNCQARVGRDERGRVQTLALVSAC